MSDQRVEGCAEDAGVAVAGFDRQRLADVDCAGVFAEESATWRWCVENVPFQHRWACEFLVYIGHELEADWVATKTKMLTGGCAPSFVARLEEERVAGATYALCYA